MKWSQEPKGEGRTGGPLGRKVFLWEERAYLNRRVGPQVEKSPNLHITRDSTGSIHENVRGKKFDPKKVRLGWGDLI